MAILRAITTKSQVFQLRQTFFREGAIDSAIVLFVFTIGFAQA